MASRLPTSCAFHLDVKRKPVGPAPGAAGAEPGAPPPPSSLGAGHDPQVPMRTLGLHPVILG